MIAPLLETSLLIPMLLCFVTTRCFGEVQSCEPLRPLTSHLFIVNLDIYLLIFVDQFSSFDFQIFDFSDI